MVLRTCEICGERSAKYICQECGRSVCEICVELCAWLCKDCYRRYGEHPIFKEKHKEREKHRTPLAMKIFFVSFLLIFAGTITLILITLLSGSLSSLGFVLLIPPLPIIFGVGEHASLLIIFAIALAITWILYLMIFSRRKI